MTENKLSTNMSIQEDVLKLRIENEQLKKENKTLKDREEGFKKQIIGLCEKYYQVYERFPELKDSFLLGDKIEKENEQLKEKISYLEDNLRVARKDREDLRNDIANGLKEFTKELPFTSLRLLANEELKEKIKNVRENLFNLLSEYEIGNYDNNIHQFYKDVYYIHNELMEFAE